MHALFGILWIVPIAGYTCYPEITLSTACPEDCGRASLGGDFDSTCLYFPLGMEREICDGENATQYDYNCVSNTADGGCTVGCKRWNGQWPNLKRVYHKNFGVTPWITAVETLTLDTALSSPTRGFFLEGLSGDSAQIAPGFLDANLVLERVEIKNLNFGDLAPNSLPPSLQQLAIEHCNLKTIPVDIGKMQVLVSLSLANNQLDQIPDNFGKGFNAFQRTTRLDLSNNQFTSIPWFLEEMTGLYSLVFTGNPISNWTVSDSLYAVLEQTKIVTWDDFAAPDSCPGGTTKKSFTTDRDQRFTFCAGSVYQAPPSEAPGLGNNQETPGGSPPGESSSSSLGLILGILAGVAVVGALSIFYYLRKRKNSQKAELMTETLTASADGLTAAELRAGDMGTELLQKDKELGKLRLPFYSLKLSETSRQGAFGIVYRATYNHTDVAVKFILPSKSMNQTEIEKFTKEIKLMGQLHHPNILNLIGVAWTDVSNLCAISEWIELDDLRSFLVEHHVELLWEDQKVRMAADIINGLMYLHSHNIIHRDMKSRNILVANDLSLKLSDFGHSRDHTVEETLTYNIGTTRWMAPEVLSGEEKYNNSADIYSFGVILTELDTGLVPFHELVKKDGSSLPDVGIAHRVVYKQMRPSFSSSCPTPIQTLGEQCMQHNPKERPNAFTILQQLVRIKRELNTS